MDSGALGADSAAVLPSQAISSKGTMEKRRHRILVADDQQDVLEALRLLLKAEGYQLELATSPRPCSPPSISPISTRC